MSHEVLVLNSDYEPLNICNMKRAISLVFLGKVDVLHENGKIFHSVHSDYHAPSVVRLKNHIKRPKPKLRLSRRSIFARDNYTCQYCGYTGNDLTVDHVIPRKYGGPTSWENLVCCCRKCNTKKGDKTLAQVGLTLTKLPREPKYVPFISLTKYITGSQNEVWKDYLPNLNINSAAPEIETIDTAANVS